MGAIDDVEVLDQDGARWHYVDDLSFTGFRTPILKIIRTIIAHLSASLVGFND